MIRLLPVLLLPLAMSLAGCSKPAPTPDAAAIDRLVASFETANQAGEGGNEAVPGSIDKKIEKADRLADTLVKVEPDRVDPALAETLIAR